ncbi:hypothetical protein M2475_000877 [Breznakia sp. PF5-3]|nr:hypothetical protein [Breznakia sp. PM6-1]MDF9835312.1 hypothetical protein [Breznakia sp. PF5-3]MDF9837028.1 hypothetical protein [Breznakia sp. PFB2-8]MDF9858953.1 hypothetical protein [Breznakia sp. PH5-24]
MMKSFLMLGQSNMAGRGFIHEVEQIYYENIKMLRNGRWQMMVEPINYDRPVAGVGLAASFAVAWINDHPDDTIDLIPCAEGGSSIDEWDVDGPLFKHAISEAKFAMEHSELTGILWHQGESDSYHGNYKGYYPKLLKIIETLRKELDVPTIPVLIGGLGDYLGKAGFGKSAEEYNYINQELESFATTQKHCYFIIAKELTCNPDGIHIDAISQRKFGLRYYEAFSKKEHVFEPLKKEPELIASIHKKEYTNTEKMFIKSMELAFGKITYEDFEKGLKNNM